MSITNYSELCNSVANWLHRTDLASVIPDFVTLAEARIARELRLQAQITRTNLTTIAGTQEVTIPTDFLEAQSVIITSVSPPRVLKLVSTEIMAEKYPEAYYTAEPTLYALIGTNMQFGPTPDAAYTVQLEYYARFAALSTSSTNWLLDKHPGIYLWACLAEASPFLVNDQRAVTWEAKYQKERDALIAAEEYAMFSGGSMRARAM